MSQVSEQLFLLFLILQEQVKYENSHILSLLALKSICMTSLTSTYVRLGCSTSYIGLDWIIVWLGLDGLRYIDSSKESATSILIMATKRNFKKKLDCFKDLTNC